MSYPHKDIAWSEQPMEVCDSDVLRTNRFSVRGIVSKEAHIDGHCPFCFGEISITRKLRLLPASPAGTTGQGTGKMTMDVTVRCACAVEHSGHPDGKSGCGRSWVATGSR